MRSGRRLFLNHLALLAAAGGVLPVARPEAANQRNAFDARSLEQALSQAGIGETAAGTGIVVKVPAYVDNPAMVDIQVSSALHGTRALAVFIERNPFPYIARFAFHAGALPYVAFRARVAESSPLRVVAFADSERQTVTASLKTGAGGCATDDAQAPDYPDPPPPIRMRAELEGGGALVRALLTHPMENGLRRQANGAPIPERYIQTFSARLNGDLAFAAELGRSVAQNPLLAFRLTRASAGDVLELRWQDSNGAVRADEFRLAA
jgi:sulfur-oxidizing protein SoxZ